MKRRFNIFIIFALMLVLPLACLSVQKHSDVPPEDVGLSSKQLDKITETLKKDVKLKRIHGAVILVARKGKIAYLASIGKQGNKAGTPMSFDTIFRIYSTTKPVVSVGILMLQDEGRLNINDPLSKYLPGFRNMKVGIEGKDKSGKPTFRTVPAKRQVTIRDLLTHTSGLTYGWYGESQIKSMYRSAGVLDLNQTAAELCKKLTKLPLVNQPGTKWEYSRAHEVLGHLIEVVSGMKLDQFLEKRIFSPMGMKDTGFYVKKDNHNRIAEPLSGKLSNITSPPKLLSGGSGLVSTTRDLYRFSRMLLNGGELDGVRILKKKTVDLMTRDHIGPLSSRKDLLYIPRPGYGFGLGVAVRIKEEAWKPGTVGDFHWGGYAGTIFWVDPLKKLIAIFMIQNPALRMYYNQSFPKWVYQTIIKPQGK